MVTLRETPEDMLGRVTRMRAKDFLYRARGVEYEIRALKESEREAWDRATRITQNYDGDGAQSTKDPHKFDALVELEYKLDERIDELCAVKTEILAAIGKLEDSRERLALQLYYIDMKTWEEVCVEMTYSWKQMMRIRKKAISHVDEIMGIE